MQDTMDLFYTCFSSKKNFVTNILKLKHPSHVTSGDAQMVNFLGGANFKDEDLQGKIKNMPYHGIWWWYHNETFSSKSPVFTNSSISIFPIKNINI